MFARFLRAIALAVGLCWSSNSILAGSPTVEQNPSAQALVQAALAAESEGDRALRKDLLQQALALDPDFAPARWHLGYVRSGNRWLTKESAAFRAREAGTVAQYRQLRDHSQETAAAHVELAEWCARKGLKDQQRFHLIHAINSGAAEQETERAVKVLGLVRYQGTLLPASQVDVLKEQKKESQGLVQKWRPRLAAMQDDLEGRDLARQRAAIDQLRAIARGPAVPVFEMLIARLSPVAVPTVIDELASIRDQSATDALVRFALSAKREKTRRAAAEALQSRSIYSYVPMLMDALSPLVQVQFDRYPVGVNVQHHLRLYQEGPTQAREFNSIGGTSSTLRMPMRANLPVVLMQRQDQTLAFDLMLASRELQANAMRQEVNDYVIEILRTATRADLDARPEHWWSWWLGHNEVDLPTEKPVVRELVDTAPNPYMIPVVFYGSCFPKGTPVQTSTGAMAIEQVRPGDSVLAQDPETGELAFKPVLATTVRPPSPLVNIRTERETIRATRGHPFWVCGLGWQMAKELQSGQWLHTANGPVQIETCEEQGQAECFNLVVADFNSYFVGEIQALVHDNNLRQVTYATVPGLATK